MRVLCPLVCAFGLLGITFLGACSDEAAGGGTTTPGAPGTAPPVGAAGNPDGKASIPAAAAAEDVSHPTTIVGTGTAESCTGAAFVDAVAKGGIITFNCGASPATVTLSTTAKIFNDKGPKIVIDGGGKVTLSGGGKVRILYMSTCDKNQVYLSGDCNKQTDPQLTVQNLTFVDGNAKGLEKGKNEGGGGAIYAQGGQLKVFNSRFYNNVCDDAGSDVGGGAIRKLDYLADGKGDTDRKVWIVNSTFGGPSLGNSCANGGALSSIGISWTILNSWFEGNTAVGHGANDGQGGNGGAIYNDGNLMHLEVDATVMQNNKANEGGSAIFFVSNNATGSLTLKDSRLSGNPRGTFETPDFPGLYVKAKGPAEVVNSTLAH